MSAAPSLSDRLKRATSSASITSVSSDATVIPYDCIRDYLEDHEMLRLFRISSRELHSALLYVERHLVSNETKDETPPPSSCADRPYDCTECEKGYLYLDAHRGHRVCGSCGFVPNRAPENVEREWIHAVRDEDLPPRHKRAKFVPGVPKWMVDRLSANPRGAYERETMEEMENMNGYMNLSVDMIRAAHRTFLSWTDNGYSRDVKMAACMFHSILHSQFLSGSEVRGMVKQRRRIPQVTDPTPQPTFPCECGVLHYSKKEARYHSCRLRRM